MHEYLSIGELARLTGLPVRTIRFYADRGVVPAADRNPAGYRLFDTAAVARLGLVRTLRELGVDLAGIQRVLDREVTLPEVAATHADALAAQIRLLRLHRAVLTVVARRGSSAEEMELVHRLAMLTATERDGLITDFLAEVFGEWGDVPQFAAIIRSFTPELPEDPTPEQVQAWVELAELAQDPDFRAALRRTAAQQASRPGLRPDPVAVVRDRVGPALAAGIEPDSLSAEPVVVSLCPADQRGQLLTWLENAHDPRRERYLELLAAINGWAAPEGLAEVFDWSIRALRARIPA